MKMTSEMISADERLAELAKKLQYHDWSYNYSDDHSVWRRGEERSAQIQSEMKYLNSLGLEEQVQALWEQYCPWSATNNKKTA
jgi:hypothetical protein